ncbi:DUF2809 domain-containing protein [Vibrio scophthalmi]|uniref:ribosomal maturation YjgA family protein n=1 Tax=Vibrio scophthalmi TaxID=45658 RepID=UPI003AAFC270
MRVNPEIRAQLATKPIGNDRAGLFTYLRFSARYAVISLCWLVVLVNIALFVDDKFIRPTLGDVLVVVWLYYTIRCVVDLPARLIVVMTVVIAFMVELAQYLKIPALLGLEPGSPLSIILGATFDWWDLAAYSVGGMVCWWMVKMEVRHG